MSVTYRSAPGPRRRNRRQPPFAVQLARLNEQDRRGMLAPGDYMARLERMGPHGQALARRLDGTPRVGG